MHPGGPYFIEPLGGHDRGSFSSGLPEFDDYLRTQAGQDARRKVATPFVLVDESRRILGYYTLSAYAVVAGELPPQLAAKLPKYPLIPATLLGRLAVSSEYRGKKLGSRLLLDALFRSWRSSSQVASVGVVAEAFDEPARHFYLHYRFLPFPDHPRKLIMPMTTIRETFRLTP